MHVEPAGVAAARTGPNVLEQLRARRRAVRDVDLAAGRAAVLRCEVEAILELDQMPRLRAAEGARIEILDELRSGRRSVGDPDFIAIDVVKGCEKELPTDFR